MDSDGPPFSVLIPVYQGDAPEFVDAALDSIFQQTRPPDEVLIVKDGPVPSELESIIATAKNNHSGIVTTVSLAENRGLGEALRHGTEACTHELVARMDADDIAVSDRFERQISYLQNHPEIDVVGGYVAEFDEDPDQCKTVRTVPTEPEKVRSKGRFRCPVNHPTVMFRRDSVVDAGNYRPYRTMQDYELWMRMLSQGYQIANIGDVLVKFRTDDTLYERRGGIEYAKTEFEILREIHRTGAISLPVFFVNIGCRIPIRLLPPFFRKWIYTSILRQ